MANKPNNSSEIDIPLALSSRFDEVGYMDFYRDIFPVGSFETKGVYEDGKYNGIAVAIRPGDKLTKRMTVTDDLDAIEIMAETDEFCLMSPISYCGKSRASKYARFMYAMAIDLDGVETVAQWNFFMNQIENGPEWTEVVFGLPKPTYLVSSGTGIHIYYVFQQPIPMFANIVKQLEVLKKRLTYQAWTMGASSLVDNVQYESLFQGFRVVGTITKNGGRCRAFRVGEKVTIDDLNVCVPKSYRATDFAYKSDLTLAQAKEKYPEWYERRIVEGKPKGSWTCNKALYDWWIKKISDENGAKQGHRYWCIMTLATYAKKCGVSLETLENDAYGLIPLMNQRGSGKDSEFTEDDVMHALEAYENSYITYPIETIVNRTGILINRNKRNGRKQAIHIKIMSSTRDILYPNGEWRNKDGRPTAELTVMRYLMDNPKGTPKDCMEKTGLSKNTVYKWWKKYCKKN